MSKVLNLLQGMIGGAPPFQGLQPASSGLHSDSPHEENPAWYCHYHSEFFTVITV